MVDVLEDELQVFLLHDPVDLLDQVLPVGFPVRAEGVPLAVQLEQAGHRVAVLKDGAEVAGDEFHRVVDLVGDSRGELADGGQFLRLHHLVLVLLELLVGLLQLGAGIAQLAFGLLAGGDVQEAENGHGRFAWFTSVRERSPAPDARLGGSLRLPGCGCLSGMWPGVALPGNPGGRP